MNLRASKKNNVPLYFQLEQIIKSKILMGEFLPGEQIPTEKDLCETYQVSTITARQAILNLVNEGLIIRRQGKGSFIKEGLKNIKNIKTLLLKGDINDIIPEGLETLKVRVLDITKIVSPKKVATLLEIGEGQEVIQVRRTRSENGIPVSYIKNYISLEIGRKIKREDLCTYPMLDILRNRLKIPLTGGIQYIEAIVADYDIASAFRSASLPPFFILRLSSLRGRRSQLNLYRHFIGLISFDILSN